MVGSNVKSMVESAISRLASKENNGEDLSLVSSGVNFNLHLEIERGRVWAMSDLDQTKMRGENVIDYLSNVDAEAK